MVTVVIPAHNAAEFVGEAIDSVIGQEWENWELIVVDDGSSDQTAAVVERYARKDDRIRLIRQPNAGVAAARNAGIAQARGAYIAPLDADDQWLAHKLSDQVQRMNDLGPGCGQVYGWWVVVDHDGREVYPAYRWTIEGHVLRKLLHVNFIGCASNSLMRREAIERVGDYDTHLRDLGGQGCEDWDLSLRIAEHYSVGLVPEQLVRYRASGGSMSGDTAQMWRSYNLVMQRLRERRPDLPGWLFRASRSSFRAYLAGVQLRKGRKAESMKTTLRAIAGWPPVLAEVWIYDALLKMIQRTIRSRTPRRSERDRPVGGGTPAPLGGETQ